MTDFVYGVSSFERARGNFPGLPVINMLAEAVPTETTTALQSRPGLKSSTVAMGTTTGIKGLFTADGVLSGALFGMSGTNLYSGSTLVGATDGAGPTSFAAYSDYVFANNGGSIWKYDGTTLAAIAFPDSANVAKIVVGGSRLVAIRANTGQFYWSSPLGVTIGALDFATAENTPDNLKDVLYVGDKLILFGTETIEYWPLTSDDALPFAPLIGSALPVGIKATGCATTFNKSFAWITNHNEVCIESHENIISEPELQVQIAASTNVSTWTFYVDDNEYLAIRLDDATWVYGARTQVWSKFESYGAANWLPQCYDGGYFGLSSSGTLAEWADDYKDFDSILERRFRAWTAITSEVLWLNNIVLRTNPGSTPYISGLYTDPIVELRTSMDGGNEWQPWKQRTLGAQGSYRKKTFWTSMGQFSYPGALVELRVSDPVPFRVSGLALNEPFGGR